MFGKTSDQFRNLLAGLQNGNGSFGHDGGSGAPPLSLLLLRVAVAEKNLQAAREAVISAAEKVGIKRGGIFAESLFLPRASAEIWCDQTERRVRAEMLRGFALAFRPPTAEEKALGDAVRAAIANGGFRGVLTEDADAPSETAAANLAQQILAAGERARSSGDHERPKPTGLARKILDAGRKRRVPMGGEDK